MENKKLGVVLFCISFLMLASFFYYEYTLQKTGQAMGCYPSQDCLGVEKTLAFSHIIIGITSFVLALGFYLIFFSKGENSILERLEKEKEDRIENVKFEMLLKALDSFEQKVVKIVQEQPGITQSTLRIKAEMSKAKLSYVLQELEKRGIIKRIEKGKTLAIYLKI